MSDVLAAYERTVFAHDGAERAVYRRGAGPAVIVIAEMPGITPKVVAFADRVAAIGCTAVLPHLFGEPGRDAYGGSRLGLAGAMVRALVPTCVSREFTVLATGRSSPVVAWLRALAADEHARCGGPGVGAVGMCFTGGFALAMATDERLVAPVLSQPSMPLALTARARRSIDISPDELAVVTGRCVADGLQVLGLRFRGDRLVPAERFAFLAEQLGDGFVAVELDDASANPDGAGRPHSVLTEHLIDEPGEPTRAALDRVLDLFRAKLLAQG
ncbi:MAG TPA: dienelactone hydrolase family protein [Acidimicrobiales bacterium]